MNYLKNEKGYALFITIVILILFTVLGMTMLALTSDGMRKNETRKDTVQGSALSEKAVARMVAEINTDLTAVLSNGGVYKSQFILDLEEALDKHLCTTKKLEGKEKTGDYEVCIEKYEDTFDKASNELNPLKKLVTFHSWGTAGDKTNLLTNQIEIGAPPYPDMLKYAIGTNINPDKPGNGEGNLLLHGSTYIEGDLKVDGNLITYDHGYGNHRWVPSFLPRSIPSVLPGEDAVAAKLVLGKEMYLATSHPSPDRTDYSSHVARNSFNGSQFSRQTKTDALFDEGSAPKLVKRTPTVSPYNIQENKSNFIYDERSSGVGDLPLIYNDITQKFYIENFSNTSNPVFPKDKWGERDRGFSMYGKNKFKKLATMREVDMHTGDHSFTDGLYANMGLNIGSLQVVDDANQFEKIKLEGSIYVQGDLIIRGADLESNAIIYVDGNVMIRHSTVNGKELGNGKAGTLIIFATGNINISNNSVYKDTPSTIKGYFYSEQDMEIYGTGSNMRIEGGISARRIVLNAIRGRASEEPFSGAFDASNHYSNPPLYLFLEGKKQQENQASRLQIIYDPEIIDAYTNLKQEEPKIQKMDPPFERERDRTRAKKK